MVQKKKKVRKGRGFIDQLSDEDAKNVLKILAKEDKKIAEKIKDIAQMFLANVDTKEVSEEVFQTLDELDVEDVYYSSGNKKGGYICPNERAWEMIAEALEPYREEITKYQKISMEEESANYCMGVLKGIYQFKEESNSEIKNWAEDCPSELFNEILDEWQKLNNDDSLEEEMQKFIHVYCRKWS